MRLIREYRSGEGGKAHGSGYLSIVQFVWRSKDVNYTDEHGKSYLLTAVEQGQPDIVDLLLRAGADPDLGDERQIRPLSAALLRRIPQRKQVIELLLRHNANPLLPSAGGLSAMGLAQMQNDLETLERFERHLLSRRCPKRTEEQGADGACNQEKR